MSDEASGSFLSLMAFSLVGSGFLLAQLGPWETLPCSAGGSVREACDNFCYHGSPKESQLLPRPTEFLYPVSCASLRRQQSQCSHRQEI